MFQVQRLQDGTFEIPAEAFIYVGDEARGARIRAEKAGAATPVPVNCFLLRGRAETILVDTGAGSAWGPGLGHARAAMTAADVPPKAVDRVILTHIHGDHALGLFDGDAAYFPRARISVAAAELGYLTDAATRAAASARMQDIFAMTDKLLSIYGGRVDRFAATEVVPGITAVPLPGHTRGHTGYRFATPAGEVLLWGDTLHLKDIQPGNPRIALTYDLDSGQALRTREAALALAAAEGLQVGGGHIPGFFRVVASGEGFRLEA
jgi:glyoxylase-like metal-dependent hydrolase (beta-lactamase superfamily II)